MNSTLNVISSFAHDKAFSSLPLAQPPWKGVGKKLESLCRKALSNFSLLDNTNKIAIALSGGKDSLSLLFLLKAISGRGFPPLDLYAIHVGGEFSCGAGIEETFLKRICQELKVPFLLRTASQKRETLECYSCSRTRRKLIFEAAKEIGVHTIAFGHHREDGIQTLLLNLLHKGEFAGMLPRIPMQRYGVTIVRPLIYASEKEIREFAQQYGFQRITCQCPVGQRSKRKDVERLIQETETLFPHVRKNLAHASLVYGSRKALTP